MEGFIKEASPIRKENPLKLKEYGKNNDLRRYYWIYRFDQRAPEHRHILKLMREALQEGIVLNVVNLIEVAHYLHNLTERVS
jgi:DNA invertase Pin-like site-specific DNA recombinase